METLTTAKMNIALECICGRRCGGIDGGGDLRSMEPKRAPCKRLSRPKSAWFVEDSPCSYWQVNIESPQQTQLPQANKDALKNYIDCCPCKTGLDGLSSLFGECTFWGGLPRLGEGYHETATLPP